MEEAVDDAVEGDRDGVRDFVEFIEVEEAAEEWCEILAELHLEGSDFSWPMLLDTCDDDVILLITVD